MRTRIALSLLLTATILIGASAHAQVGGVGQGLFNTRPGTTVDYGYLYSGASSANGVTPSPEIDQHFLRVVVEPHREGKNFFSVHAGGTSFDTAKVIPLSNAPTAEASVPKTLWDLGAGVAFNRELESGRSLGGAFTVGSANNRPFEHFKDTIFNFTGTYTKPVSESHSWVYAVNWTNNRSFLNNIPLPFLAYQIREPSVGLFAFVGLPVVIALNPFDSRVGYRLVIMPSGFLSETSYKVYGPAQVYGRAEWGQEVWMRAERLENKDRIIFDQKRVSLGFRTPTPGGFLVDLAGSFAFDRRFIQGSSVYTNIRERADLEPTWLVNLKISYMPDYFEMMKKLMAEQQQKAK